METDSVASCGVLNPPLCGIVQLTNSDTLRFRNWSFNNKELRRFGENYMKNEEFKKGEIAIYKAKGGPIIDVRLKEEIVWLTQKQMSLLFDKNTDTIGLHLLNI